MTTFEIEVAGFILGTIGSVVAGVYWLKYTATKANIDGKNETITTQTGQITALDAEVTRLHISEQAYKKQAEALKEVAQQTPQIVDLTRAITKLTTSIQKQHLENIKDRKQQTAILQKLLNEKVTEKTAKKNG